VLALATLTERFQGVVARHPPFGMKWAPTTVSSAARRRLDDTL
jgi:hypothetical protein